MPSVRDARRRLKALHDPERLEAVRRTELLDREAPEALQRLVRLASRVIDAPVSVVSILDRDRQFFAAQVGLPEPWASRRETPLTHSFCQHVTTTRTPLVVRDARDDDVLRENHAIQDLGVIGYAGIPLDAPDGHNLGSFCVIDDVPREWTDRELDILGDLAHAAMAEIGLRVANRVLREKQDEIERLWAGLSSLGDAIPLCAWCKSVKIEEGDWRTVEEVLLDLSELPVSHGLCPTCETKMTTD